MSLVMYRQLKGMIDRGTVDLATIDAAERKRVVTAQEAADLRAYWQIVWGEPEPGDGAHVATDAAESGA